MTAKRIGIAAVCILAALLVTLALRTQSKSPAAAFRHGSGVPTAPQTAATTSLPVPENQVSVKVKTQGKLPPSSDSSVPLRRVVGERVYLIKAKDWRNVGDGTLADAIQTEYWALAGGNIEYLQNAIVLDEPAREAVAELRARASASVQKDYDTPARFAAFMLIGVVGDLEGMSVHSQKPINDNETRVAVDTLHPGAGVPYLHHENFRKGSDGKWRRVVTAQMAADWAAGRGQNYQKPTVLK